MAQLTYADRETLLQIFDSLKDEWNGTDEQLLSDASDWAKQLVPSFGFEQALLRNLVQLSNYLRLHRGAEDIASIARGAIQFIVGDHGQPALDEDPTKASECEASEFHALGQAFIASYAVYEIAVRLSESVAYNPPAITKEEQAKAEEIFEKLSVAEGCDAALVGRVVENLNDIQNLAGCGFLKRLTANARTLIEVLKDSKRPEDERICARGALRYLVENDDAISDNLGLVGYLDDVFILQIAVDLVSPLREPLIELLDQVVGVWPFLNMLTLDDGSGPRAASEFAILNFALCCCDLHSSDTRNTMLIAPETGPIAILLGFVTALGLAYKAGQRQLTEESFTRGQKVLVDYDAVAEFDGFDATEDGRRIFWLKRYNETRGSKMPLRITWPISDLHRLVPVECTRAIRGEIERSKRNKKTELSGLDFLFNGPLHADVHAIEKQVIVVMPTMLAAEFCKSTQLYGQPLKDVIPVGQVSADGESGERWSTRFGVQKPILLFASDLDVARTYAEEHHEKIELVIVDVAGRNREKHASMKRLNRLQIPCLLIATERVANETEVDQHNDLSVWEWSPEDLTALVWPETKLTPNSGEIARFEHRVQSSSTTRPIVESISLPIATETDKAFLALRRLVRKRSADKLPELEEIIAEAFFTITQLMRCASPLTAESACIKEISGRIGKICELASSSNFLSDEEQAAIEEMVNRTNEFAEQLQENNPKAKALDVLLSKYPNATVLCPDARLIAELEAVCAGKRNRIIASVSNDIEFTDGLIIAGWFREKRMAAVLSPPITDPLVLILYDVERRWHQQFSQKRRTKREERRGLKGRAAIFPSMSGWKAPKPPSELPAEIDATGDDIEGVQTEIDDSFRQRIYARVQSGESDADAKARLLLFAGGAYGLFTDNYKLNVVTHLLDGSVDDDDEKASVKLAATKDVRIGDAVVFRPKSRDLIREVADELLQPGQRAMSNKWQRALRKYADKHGLSAEWVCDRLQKAGCKASLQAIRNWIFDEDMIGPQQYRNDVPAIAQVTGDADLASNVEAVVDAIKHVRSAHQQKAPRVIAKRIRQKAASVVRQEQADHSIVHLAGDLVLVRVAEPASDLIPIKYASANRLIEGDSWHE